MDHMKFETPDLTAQNIEKIAALFPGCVTEGPDGKGGLKKAINFELLKQMLSDDVLEGDESYEFTWVGKKASIVEANKPIRKTLRPCPEESKNWDTTENLYIEGDNLEVLKLLQEAYLGKVKMIYIDPPYNTGHDFIYNDRFEMGKQEYDQQIGLFDEEGNKQFAENSESSPRFHSDWCSMMYPRLMLARNMLTDDGVIFISIDDNEQDSLKKIANEIFGPGNFIATIIWRKNYAPKSSAQYFSVDHDYILVYTKCSAIWRPNLLPRTEKQNSMYSNPDNDPRGPWRPNNLSARNYYSKGTYPIKCPGGRIIEGPPSGRYWIYSEEKFWQLDKEGRIYWGPDGNNIPAPKTYLSEVKQGIVPQTYWSYEEVGHTQEAKKELLSLLSFATSQDVFDTPKPTRLIKRMLQIATTRDGHDIVMDFFCGSATTAHAVMAQNAEDGGNRQFIMVQLPQPIKSEGFSTLCDIGKERIRRAGDMAKKALEEEGTAVRAMEKFKKEHGTSMGFVYAEWSDSPEVVTAKKKMADDLDIGFRVLKLDDTNMEDVYYSAQEYDQGMLQKMESNIKPDRTDLDLLFGCLLEWGLPLSMPYRSEQVEGCTVHTYNDGDLIACFDENIPENVIREIAKRKPLRAVFRDSGFATSPEKINVGEIFKLLAPDTRVKVI
ncbi:site-specific DNA-methyltransferase [Pseudoflavonifractor phocaeensis]|uniref:site-specific DNA-methyltransferase n=1 Tax=Pseudoflavonifractor phocaeensis TaxID=1870988 RepID=UPI00195822B7|nr:site-specific DNA-methyltransferase [Pseudoflavonifractor phocaeensis]MBM6924570.1 site-specific DNA-methyltransferase [Pseudoflavonifractor phocaeensis]